MLDLGSGVAGGARGWVAGRAGLWGVPPTWVWVVGVSPQTFEHPTSICDTGVIKGSTKTSGNPKFEPDAYTRISFAEPAQAPAMVIQTLI